jgi:hypothetical protein
MEIDAEAYQSSEATRIAVEVDVSLRSAPAAGEHAIPIDRIMVAVDGVHRFVASRLTRIGRSCDVDDVMQDIRVAVWDGVAKGRYRELPGSPLKPGCKGFATRSAPPTSGASLAIERCRCLWTSRRRKAHLRCSLS